MTRAKKRCVSLCLFAAILALAACMAWQGGAYVAQAAGGITVTVSSEIRSDDYRYENLTDGKEDSYWYSQWADTANPACEEWITIDFGEIRKIDSIMLTPILDATQNVTCFPADFTIEWSVTGEVFVPIEGFDFKDYKAVLPERSKTIDFRIFTPARFIRIYITKRTQNPEGHYIVGLAEIGTFRRLATDEEKENAIKAEAAVERRPVVDDPVISSTATASTSNRPEKDWGVANINDGLVSSQWCAEWGDGVDSEECDEWVMLTFSKPQRVTGVILKSLFAQHYGFPKNFAFEWTLDGENFFPIEGASFEDESIESTTHVKVFANPIVTTAIRMNITVTYPDSQDHYIAQLAEMQAHGREATEQEFAEAATRFDTLMGETKVVREKDPIAPFRAVSVTMLVLFILFTCATAGLIVWICLDRRRAKKNAGDTASA